MARHDADVVERTPAYRQIIAFRNVLIHGYDLVDHALIWNAVEHQLPALLKAVQGLLREAPGA